MKPFDEETLERIRACKKGRFPICLNEGLLRMFGPKGKEKLDSIIMDETFEISPISSPKDIWKLYEDYMERAANILGDDVAKVIEFESLLQMKTMLCTNCPFMKEKLKSEGFLLCSDYSIYSGQLFHAFGSNQTWYCSLLTISSQSTVLPFSFS